MKKVLLLFLTFSFQATTFNFVSAQRKITTERIEVTKRLDANPDKQAQAIFEHYKPAVDSLIAPILGESLVGMSAGRPESLLSNWGADVLVESSELDGGQRADMGLMNIGGLRNNMPQGVVRKGDVMLISPFNNYLAIVTLKGTDLLELMQNIAARMGEGVSHEVRLVISKDGKLLDAKINGQPIDPERNYRVATVDYLTEGNDGMFALKKAVELKVCQSLVRDCMMQNIERKGKITSTLEGRIIVK